MRTGIRESYIVYKPLCYLKRLKAAKGMSNKKELLSKIGLRLDGRRPNELRRIRCKLGVFTEPDGSAYVEQGLTKVLAAVYGPHQV